MKLAIFSKIGNHLSAPELCAMLVEQGYRGVEWQTHPDGHVKPERVLEDARAVTRATREYGLDALCLSGYLKLDDLGAIEEQLAAAGDVGCPHVRVWPPAYRGNVPYRDLLDGARRDLERIAGMARRNGTRAVMEIHYGNIAPSAGLMYRLVEAVDPRDVGLIYDPDNFTREGMENWQLGLELLGPYLAYVQFKNSAWVRVEDDAEDEGAVPPKATAGPAYTDQWRRAPAALEDGLVSWPAFVRVLRRVGYDGYLSCEDGRPVPLRDRLADGREVLTHLWHETA